MTTTQGPLYLCLFCGEETVLCFSKEEMLVTVEMHCNQHISDHLRHKLPLKITPEKAAWFDVKVFVLTDDAQVEIPFQELADKFYEDMRTWEPRDTLRDYERFLELRGKFANITEEELAALRKEAKFDS